MEVIFEAEEVRVNIVDGQGTMHSKRFENLMAPIDTEWSRFRVSKGKRVSITLKKIEHKLHHF